MMYDCIICGAGPSGIMCALGAKKLGLNVLLIESEAVVGGTNILSLVTPLMSFYSRGKNLIGGIAEEMMEELVSINESKGHLDDPLGFCEKITPVDTDGLKRIYFSYLEKYGVDVLLSTKVIASNVKNGHLTSITVSGISRIYNLEAKYFIDATGDGTLSYLSNATYQIGRKVDNLTQPSTMSFIVGGVDLEKIKAEIKKDKTNFVLRDDYDYKYVGVSGFFKEVKKAKENGDLTFNRDRVLFFENNRNNEVTINMTRIAGYDFLDEKSFTYATFEGMKQIDECFKFLKKYIPGFENSYIIQTPNKLGVRETRHIECLYMITKEDVLEHKTFSDSIACSTFPMDIHSPNKDGLEIETNINDWAFEIPLRSVVVKGFDNLFVAGRSIGATHEAQASLRVTPVCYSIGEAISAIISVFIRNEMDIYNYDYKLIEKEFKKLKHNYKI